METEKMMLAALGLILAGEILAQPTAATQVFRGTLLEWDGSSASGQFSLRTADHHVYCFLLDAATRFEGDGRRMAFAEVKSGDTLEVLAEQCPGVGMRCARAVRVLASRPVISLPSYRRHRPLGDELLPRGRLTFAGVVSWLNEERLVLRTRTDPEKRILLRSDTRYIQNGSQVTPSVLKVNTRIFVRAGETLEGEVEAYQVIWGGILKPSPN